MAHTKNFIVILCSFVLLASCSNQKQQQKETNTASLFKAVDTANADYKQAVNITMLNDAYTSSITQTFIVKQKNITVVTGKKGLKVTVNPSALETEDGSAIDGNIIVKMTELTTSEELFKSNAGTMSNGRLLVSGGSYFIGMECNGKKLQLKNNQSLQMELPKIKESEMELFYGKRYAAGSMNWTQAQTPLVFKQQWTTYKPPFPYSDTLWRFKSRFRLYDSVTATVKFMDKKITIKEMVAYLNNKGVDKNIDSLYIPWENFFGRYYDSTTCKGNYSRYIKKYRVISCKEIDAEKDSLSKEEKLQFERHEANRKYSIEWERQNEANSITSQLQKYYAPSSVTALGWINCDRFYDNPQNTDIPVDIPYTFQQQGTQYFLIYKNFNGLMSGKLEKNAKQQYLLPNLPLGQPVTLVAFTKNNGQVYQWNEEFVITADKVIKPDFKIIDAEEMKKMFGANVKI